MSGPPEGLFPLNRDSLLYGFEERIAIAQYDGCQNEVQAHLIAYQDAFISVLNAVPYDQERDLDTRRWLDQRIKAAQVWLAREGGAEVGGTFRITANPPALTTEGFSSGFCNTAILNTAYPHGWIEAVSAWISREVLNTVAIDPKLLKPASEVWCPSNITAPWGASVGET